MRSISEPFIRRPVMTLVLTVSAILFGVLAYRALPVNDLPAVDYPVIQVSVGYPGANPETVASTIATPLERQFMQIPGLEVITSKSSQGFCTITIQFALDKSLDAAATDVQAAISRATGSLPVDLPAPPTFTKTNPNDQPILYIGLTSDSLTRGQLYDLANTQVGQRISIVSGVSQVQVYGTKSAVRIKADPAALAQRNLSVSDLANAIQQGTTYQGAGQLDGSHRTFLLQPQGQLENAEQYNKLIIGMRNNTPIYLRDVASARDTVQDERIDMRFWVRGRDVPKATVVVAVFRQAGSNAVDVAQRVRDLLPVVQPELPAGVSVVPIHDRSRSIVNSVHDVTETLYIAFILVVLVIFLFLGRATDTLIPVVALPLSLLLTFIVMQMLGYSLDNLSLMALTLAIGFLVDDAIVFLENVVRRMEQRNERPMQAAINSAGEISFTIISMTLSLAAVFIPLVFMSGLVGRIFREFAVTIIVSIIASGVVSLTLTPLMCARLIAYRGHGSRKTFVERLSGAVEHRILKVYGGSLWFFLRHKWVSALIWVGCLAGTIYLLKVVPRSFLPVGDSSFSWGFLVANEGASPEEMRDLQSRAEEVMQQNESIKMTFTMTGNNMFLGSNQGLLLAFLKDPKDRPPMTTFDGQAVPQPDIQAVSSDVATRLAMSLPGAFGVMSPQPTLEISTGATRRGGGSLSYSISGINPDEVYDAAQKLHMKMMSEIGTLFDGMPFIDMYRNTPNLRIDILRERASTYNVTPAAIETLLRNAYSQNYVYLIKQPQDQYQVVLETIDPMRREPEDLAQLYVRSEEGKMVPLSAVATWTPTTGPQAVNHLNQFTSVTWQFSPARGRTIEEVTNFIDQAAKEILPQSVRGQYQGEALTFRETTQSLTILMILAVFVMYVILGILYESFIHPITVLSTLPTAMVGGLATLLLFNETASLYAFVGLFMLMGIVKKNGIMIVDFAMHRVNAGEDAAKAIHDASMDRFRPIMMTTLAAVMGAVPIALGWGADGAGRRPLGLVIVGGLIVSQLITLYVTPVIYLYMELLQEWMQRKFTFLRSPEEREREHPGREPVPALAMEGNGNGNGH